MSSIKTKFALISLSHVEIPLKSLRTNAHYWVLSSTAESLSSHFIIEGVYWGLSDAQWLST